jgi:CHRD domain
MIGGALVAGVALASGLALLRPQTLWAQGGTAQGREFLALCTGSQEVPSVDTPAVAFGRFTLSADKTQLSYDIQASGLKGTFTQMHLHRAPFGQPGDIVYPLAAPNVSSLKGTVAFNPADEATLVNQGFYFNIHTDAFPGGEIRGQVVPAPVVVAATPQATVSFARDIQPIFNTRCSCHIGGVPAEGQNLAAGQAIANIVNVKSRESALDRIEPGDPEKSYMIHKLRGTQRTVGGSGSRMPLGGAALPPAQLQLLETWIKEGAQNN